MSSNDSRGEKSVRPSKLRISQASRSRTARRKIRRILEEIAACVADPQGFRPSDLEVKLDSLRTRLNDPEFAYEYLTAIFAIYPERPSSNCLQLKG